MNGDTPFAVPVLCYHSWMAGGDDYVSNHHVALKHDLKALAVRGYKVISIPLLVDILCGRKSARCLGNEKMVGLTFDDGHNLDYVDGTRARCGSVPSFRSILCESRDWLPLIGEGPRAVSFVIVAEEARAAIDSRGGMDDRWWKECAAGGVIGIANHSWDHAHGSVAVVRQRENRKDSFLDVDTFDDAEAQIADAQRLLMERTDGLALPLFGYPYGHVSAYLRDEYFPVHGERIGIEAAFGTGGAPVTPDCSRWDIPRYVCGDHWCSEAGLAQLLSEIRA